MLPEVDTFLVFDGDCRDAVGFYAKVFDIDPNTIQITEYGELDGNLIYKDFWDKVILAEFEIFGKKFYAADYTEYSNTPYIKGNNQMLTIGFHDETQLKNLFEALKENGSAIYSLRKTEASDLMGIVIDQFGIIWQLSLAPKGQKK